MFQQQQQLKPYIHSMLPGAHITNMPGCRAAAFHLSTCCMLQHQLLHFAGALPACVHTCAGIIEPWTVPHVPSCRITVKSLSERTDLQALAAEIVEKCKLIHPSKVMKLSQWTCIVAHGQVLHATYVAVQGLRLSECRKAWGSCCAHSVHGLSKGQGQLALLLPTS